MFDQLLLLTQSGDAVYFGDINKKVNPEKEEDPDADFDPDNENANAQKLLEYCAEYGYEMEKERNPADFALEFATGTNRLAEGSKDEDITFEDKQKKEEKEKEEESEGDSEESQPKSPVASGSKKKKDKKRGKKKSDLGPKGYVEKVEDLVEGFYQSELHQQNQEEADEIQPIEFKINYRGIIIFFN